MLSSTVTHQKELLLNIEYKLNPQLTEDKFIDILNRSTLGERRPKHGIGKKLIEMTQKQLNEKCKIILLSAPAATEYYPKVGFTQHPSAWTLSR